MQCPENKATTLITAVEYVKILAGMEAKKRHKNNMLRMEYQRLQGAVWFNGRSVCVVRVLHDMIIDACMYGPAYASATLCLAAQLQQLPKPFGAGVTENCGCGKTVTSVDCLEAYAHTRAVS